MKWFLDRKVRLPRIWSNRELEKFSKIYSGDVVNVSAWIDQDKEGRRYRDYFSSASSYSITNYLTEAKGLQDNMEDQIFLDLEDELPAHLKGKFDVVFNHTVLEHVFECSHAFRILCEMTSDTIILVVPFLQHQHSAYGDYWRFTPEGISRLFKKNGMELLYINYNDGPNQFIYIFAIASKHPEKWKNIKLHTDNKIDKLTEKVGYRLVKQGILFRTRELVFRLWGMFRRAISPILGR